jgi:outer membrane cobalamin receptor
MTNRAPRSRLAAVCLAVACLPPAAFAAEAEEDPFALTREEQVVEAASRHPQSVDEAPAAVTVITSRDIARFGWTTLAEVLRSVRGFWVSTDLNYAYAGIRGIGRPSDYNNRLLLLLNGHRMNGMVYEDVLLGRELALDLGSLKRIEVVRGPNSALYGTDAVFGVVNLVTWDAADAPPFGVILRAAGHGDLQGEARGAVQLRSDLSLYLSGRVFRSDGLNYRFAELATPENPLGDVRGADAEDGQGAFFNLSGRQWTLEGFLSTRQKHIPNGSYDALPGNYGTFVRDSRGYLELRGRHQVSPGLGLDGRAYLEAAHYDGLYVYPPADSGAALVEQVDAAEGWAAGAEARASVAIGSSQSAQFIAEFRAVPRCAQYTYDRAPAQEYVRLNEHTALFALTVQDEIRLSRRVTATLALRQEHLDRSSSEDFDVLSPHAALVWNAGGAGTFKVGIGQSFRWPSAYESYYDPGYYGYPVQSLEAERIVGFDLAWEKTVGGVHLAVTPFFNSLRNLIDQIEVGDGLGFASISKARSVGVGAEVSCPLLGGTASAWTAFQRSEDGDGVRLNNSPTATACLKVWRPWAAGRIQTALEYVFTSRRETLLGAEVPQVHLLNFHSTWPTWKSGPRLGVRVTNILDRVHLDPVGSENPQDVLPQPGRALRLHLKFGAD